MARRRTIRASHKPVITITRHGLDAKKLVYLAKANKARPYPFGRSAIVYIGTTRRGVRRIASSAASKAQKLLGEHGVKQLDFFVVSCRPLRKVETWRKLENALILTFRQQYGAVPLGNQIGKKQKWDDELEYFSERRLRAVLDKFSK